MRRAKWMRRWRRASICSVAFLLAGIPGPFQLVKAGEPERRILRADFTAGETRLRVEILDDDLALFEYSPLTVESKRRIESTPMVAKRDYAGAKLAEKHNGAIATADLELRVDPKSLCMTLLDTTSKPPKELTTICPGKLSSSDTSFTLAAGHMTHAYGLGEQFIDKGQPHGDWVGRVRTPGCEFGNRMIGFGGGAVGNNMFPILYALGGPGENYAIFIDDLHAQTWDLKKDPWKVKTGGARLRGYLMTGPDLPDLRRDYMELVGHPPVPPKKMFGLWVSEYGYDDWAELKDKLATLRKHRFPVDGFVLDLQWFGGIAREKPESRMGSLAWDTKKFPSPKRTLAQLAKKDGVGVIPIEESYVSLGRPDFKKMKKAGYFAHDAKTGAASIMKSWWGEGGMIDWTNTAGADDWHDRKRQRLVDDGVLGHWTDLGEPEDYDPKSFYNGLGADSGAHRDVHNLLNFRWLESIHRGYAHHVPDQRAFMMSRSGITGVQRFGAAMWSGDIGSNVGSLATHFNAQMHMSMSGMDYFGADTGGFKRNALDGDENELYTMWMADACAFDVPVRPHTANTKHLYQTAPDRIGDLESNRTNLRRRYELIPYLYSLAHRAYEFGEPVVPPLVFYYQNDPEVRKIGDEKLIGRDLLAAAVYQYSIESRDVYLPAGVWYDYWTGERIESTGQWTRGVPVRREGRLTLPMFARAGAIIPLMHVDEETMNAVGMRLDGSRRDELIVRVFAGDSPTQFQIYEDDGKTNKYQRGEVRKTVVRQQPSKKSVTVTIEASIGRYDGAPKRRPCEVRLATGGSRSINSVTFNGKAMEERKPGDVKPGWCRIDSKTVMARSAELDVGAEKIFDFVYDAAAEEKK